MKKIFVCVTVFITLLQLNSAIVQGQSQMDYSNAKTFDASSLEWKLWAYRQEVWRNDFNFETLKGEKADIIDIPVTVPGSVQNALRKEGIISDWNIGLNSWSSEWIENRHWLYTTSIPDKWLAKDNEKIILNCDGLDYKGTVYVNGKNAGTFDNAFIPYSFNISKYLKESGNTLVILFETPPENLAQVCWTSKITEWKPRFNFGWDWVPRIVQIGIWDNINFKITEVNQAEITELQVSTDANKNKDLGILKISAKLDNCYQNEKVSILLSDLNGKNIFKETISAKELLNQKVWTNLNIKRWWPNGFGEQPLYNLEIKLLDENGVFIEKVARRIGFKHTEWLPCEGASVNADPWICSINNQAIFLQGVNWTPILPNFADLKEKDYKKLLSQYRDFGINTIRIWGGGFPEKDCLYDLCDEFGILIMQDFPLSSSGLDNYPPEGLNEVFTVTKIVQHYIIRLKHHTSILLWCAGNELYEFGDIAPVTDKHIMIKSMKEMAKLLDPTRRFTNGSPAGPNIYAGYNNFGSGNNWDVHGPWTLPFSNTDSTMNAVKDYWSNNDALFHSEVGVAGAMSVEMINKYKGEYAALPANVSNPLWRNVNWWIEWDEYLADNKGQHTNDIEKYVEWSQHRQTEGLSIALKSKKDKFPSCGGFILWMGHDCFPCMVNTSIIDFEGNPKPAVKELSKIWLDNSKIKKYKHNTLKIK